VLKFEDCMMQWSGVAYVCVCVCVRLGWWMDDATRANAVVGGLTNTSTGQLAGWVRAHTVGWQSGSVVQHALINTQGKLCGRCT
jgi:hypothetical protein